MSARPLHVALIGSRGVPARYGGYETLMEELGVRLVARGMRVTVYCRAHYTPAAMREHRGMELVVQPTLRGKYFDTPVHTFLSGLDAQRRGFDAALVVNGANALFLPLLAMAGVPTALNVDGIEKRRAKWGWPGRTVYALSERLACTLPTVLVTDAEVIRAHYLARYGVVSEVIAYGVDPRPPREIGILAKLGLRPREYFLYVSRFEPENHPREVAEAYRGVGGELPLVMVGGAPYAEGYIRSFTAEADRRILFPGPIYGEGYRELLAGALAYVHATEVGGTHPALVEAMGYGNCVLVHDTPENREVAGEAARYFDVGTPSSLRTALDWARTKDSEVAASREAAASRAAERYSWDEVADRYASLLRRIALGAG